MPDLLSTRITNRWVVRSSHANHLGTAHGGSIVKWMDEVGGMAAVRFAGQWCVTAHMDSVDFVQPIEVDDAVRVEGYVYEAGETSVQVRVEAFKEDMRTGEGELASEADIVYVAVDEGGEPSPVPELQIDSEEGERLQQAALSDSEDD
ncbi:acyl-CoA thioesterase [Halodesulfurarchaeum sp. HSR-GB]|uniref:acyl-CoA thioesterase n=1 Tax=Halodesulfurarchaeum sp. HSR-GB TaxID=3074077 RepID=UPI00285DD913|nr:acyl-CoA thioesterase [Halodesulfurarchaeum sp. HSR-GB]MDR5657403.1 acyl-CoA thioesterase [Halodesulfurarchaeum sp. HSR-GB]